MCAWNSTKLLETKPEQEWHSTQKIVQRCLDVDERHMKPDEEWSVKMFDVLDNQVVWVWKRRLQRTIPETHYRETMP